MSKMIKLALFAAALTCSYYLANWFSQHQLDVAKPNSWVELFENNDKVSNESTMNQASPSDAAIMAPDLEQSLSNSSPQTEIKLPNRTVEQHIEFSACSRNKAPIEKKAAKSFYTWVDENGQKHYADSVPDNIEAEELQPEHTRKDYFDLSVTFTGKWRDTTIEKNIEKVGYAIYNHYEQLVGKNNLSKSKVNVRLYDNAATFHSFRRQAAPETSNDTAGFYQWPANLVFTYQQKTSERTQEVAIHELVHVINAEHFGPTPRWFNEGLAEYYELSEPQWGYLKINYNTHHLRSLGNRLPIQPLTYLLNADAKQWFSEQGSTLYANAWAFVTFMMEPHQQDYLKTFAQTLLNNKCRYTDSVQFFQQHYPGGIAGLQKRWHQWLAQQK